MFRSSALARTSARESCGAVDKNQIVNVFMTDRQNFGSSANSQT